MNPDFKIPLSLPSDDTNFLYFTLMLYELTVVTVWNILGL